MLPITVKQGLCKNCYACIRSCEVKATSIRQGQASLIAEDCLSCGKCLTVCPQHAREIREDILRVHNVLRGSAPVWVSLAPSAALGPWSLSEWEQRLKAVGFAGVSLTSWGAIPTIEVFEECVRKDGYVLTTACPAAVKLVCRYFPRLAPRLALVASPMMNHAAWLRQTYGARVVFIGPCPAKKEEAQKNSLVDVVLTFAEAEKLLGQQTSVESNRESQISQSFSMQGLTNFPVPGGLATQTKTPVLSIDGVEELLSFLKRLSAGQLSPNGIIEMSACRGSCLGGAEAYRRDLTISEKKQVLQGLPEDSSHSAAALRSSYFPTSPHTKPVADEAIEQVLKQLGKADPSSEYNCGACGYHTCREKATAVVLGRAELEMCLPYMRAKAESLANLILSSTPNAVVVVDQNLCVKEWNEAAERVFGLPAYRALHQPLLSALPGKDFLDVLNGAPALEGKKIELNPRLTLSVSITPVKSGELAMGVFTDITQVEEQAQALAKVRQETLEKAQEVINKQMRVAHEIAGLLGETTAESKTLLLKLMKVVQGEQA